MSQEVLNIISISGAVIAIAALIVSAITLGKVIQQTKQVIKQTEYVRKQVFGEVYEHAQIKDLRFYLPERQKHMVEGFAQKEDVETDLGKSITIPVGYERELHLTWRMAESQTLRSFTIGFGGSFLDKPKIIERTIAFVKNPIDRLPREEYIDWHGTYHCEFGHARRLPKDEPFVSALKVKGVKTGEYDLVVEIFVAEAPLSFKESLKIIVQ